MGLRGVFEMLSPALVPSGRDFFTMWVLGLAAGGFSASTARVGTANFLRGPPPTPPLGVGRLNFFIWPGWSICVGSSGVVTAELRKWGFKRRRWQ